ncbi:MAG TPA: exodeoxyribonuclease VII small subunit [Mariniphaga anaerophila]|uniref:Exodeoxyribonuclease VII small subunit n=1 Tax=Mariniphaga anaerophila TaxID=1484053 RepID=A0A831LUM7_9BACT|nr:exodeoxyribonuclease VII small subunit [Mariniphaga anaerophila]
MEKFKVKSQKKNNMATKKVTYNEAVSEIEEILEKIESEELDVDELTEKVKRVSVLLKICKDKLLKTNEQVEQILKEMEE